MGPLFVFLSDGSGKFEFFVFFIDPRVVIIQTKLNFLACFLSFFLYIERNSWMKFWLWILAKEKKALEKISA